MTKQTYVSSRRTRRFGTGSVDARTEELMEQRPLEEIEEMAVAAKDEEQRAELEEAVRRGRMARGGTSDSGGAVRSESSDRPRHGGRFVLDDDDIGYPAVGMPDELEALRPQPKADRPKRRWSLTRFRR